MTDASLVIRPLRVHDLDRIFGSRSRPFGEEWLNRQARSEIYVAVAERDGVPVGRVGLDFVAGAARGVAVVWAAHVEPGYQSQGIGTAILLHLEQAARRRGFAAIELAVGKENARAQRLYDRLGYVVCGEQVSRWSYREGDRTIEVAENCWTMRKGLRLQDDPTPMSLDIGVDVQ